MEVKFQFWALTKKRIQVFALSDLSPNLEKWNVQDSYELKACEFEERREQSLLSNFHQKFWTTL